MKLFLEITLGRENLISDVFFSDKSERLGTDHEDMNTMKKT